MDASFYYANTRIDYNIERCKLQTLKMNVEQGFVFPVTHGKVNIEELCVMGLYFDFPLVSQVFVRHIFCYSTVSLLCQCLHDF